MNTELVLVNKNANEKLAFPLRVTDLKYLRTTSISVLESCRKQWAAQFLLGMGLDTEGIYKVAEIVAKPTAGQVGTAAHLICEDFQTENIRPEQHPIFVLIPEKERDNLLNYVYDKDRLMHDDEDIISLEYEFELEMIEGVPPIRGHIDKLSFKKLSPSTYVITDYKTNRAFETVAQWSSKPQQRIYAWAIKQLFPDCQMVIWRIGYINHAEDVEWISTPEEDEAIIELVNELWQDALRIGQLINDPNNLSMWPETLHANCTYCPLSKTCQTYNRAVEGFDQSFLDTLPDVLVEKREKLKVINKLITKELENLDEKIIEQLKIQDITYNNVKYYLENKSQRKIAFKDFWPAALKIMNQYPEFYDELIDRHEEIFTVKVTGVDKLVRDLGGIVDREISPTIYDKVSDEVSIGTKKLVKEKSKK